MQVRRSPDGWFTYALDDGPSSLPPVSRTALDGAWHAAREAAIAGDWGAARGIRFRGADGSALDLALTDRDAGCWAAAIDRGAGLHTRSGLSLLMRLLALVDLLARAAWTRPLCRLARDGAELDPALLAAAATEPLAEDGRFDEARMHRRLGLGRLDRGRPLQPWLAGALS